MDVQGPDPGIVLGLDPGNAVVIGIRETTSNQQKEIDTGTVSGDRFQSPINGIGITDSPAVEQ